MPLIEADAGAAARDREWRRQVRNRARAEAALTRALAVEIAGTGRAAVDAVGLGDLAALDPVIAVHERHVAAIVKDHYAMVWLRWGRALFERAPSKADALEIEWKADDPVFKRLLAAWIEHHAGRRVTAIADATAEQIRVAVAVATAEAVEAGLATAAAAKRMRAAILSVTDSDVGRLRALTIARTETHAASQAASDQAAEMLDLPGLEREWVAASDGRTRPSHGAASGQRQPKGVPFRVGDSLLMHPGDPAGAAREVINCRCVLVFVAP